jgi:hypothetical protein
MNIHTDSEDSEFQEAIELRICLVTSEQWHSLYWLHRS